jgi:DNA-binding GntR family transcriptional regulator
MRNMILSRQLLPRTRQRQEEIAQRLGISRTPVREALRVLTQEGLLNPVAGGSSSEVVDLTVEDARDLYQVRAPIDGLTARLCALRHDELPVDEIAGYLDELVAAADPFDAARFSDAHTRFHLSLARASGNRRLVQLSFIVQLSTLLLYPRYLERPDRMLKSAQEHRDIFAEILAGNAAEAEKRAIRHIETALDTWFGDVSYLPSLTETEG